MSKAADIVVVGMARTAIGSFGGALRDIPPLELGAHVARAAIARAGLPAENIGQVFCGQVIHTEARDMYLARAIALQAGLAASSCALTVNRLCGSGLQAVLSAAQSIERGETKAALALGVESMSRAGYLMPAARFGARMGNTSMIDMMVGALTDPLEGCHMGITAENIAARWQISRAEQDAFALQSQQRAIAAIDSGYFDAQIAPLEIHTRQGSTLFARDEYPKRDASAQTLAALKPAFKAHGSVTAGNASGINDAAAALVLMAADAAAHAGLTPLARLAGCGLAGVAPELMGTGPIPATQIALAQAGIQAGDLDVIESNEAFAVQAMCVSRELGLDPQRVNPNGGAIALGHPLAASGAILSIKCIDELQRTGGRYGLVTLCIGGGQGIAAIFERC